ncbi:MAG: arylsulfatase A family protein [Candidatus Hydrogenedentota bacterium]
MKKHPASIDRRAFLQCCIAGTGALCGLPALRAAAAGGTQPNIVFIFTDDQASWTIRALGGPDAYTPNLDRLFGESVTCPNAFVTTPVCSPSRLGLLTSRYGTEFGITDWIKPQLEHELGADPSLPTWVKTLRDAGYATGLVGKWHLGVPDRFHPSVFGYQHFAGFRIGGAPVENPEMEIDGEKKVVTGLTVDVITDLGMDFIRKNAKKQPFMVSIHHRSPHRPWPPHAEEDMAPYKDRKMTIPNPDYPDLDVERVEEYMRDYLESVSGVDRNVGRVMDLLKELEIEENTIVIFSSDHGYNVGHHGIIHKGNASWMTKALRDVSEDQPLRKRPNMFDTSLRVPVAVRWPGVLAPGSTMNKCITNLDWYPTLLAMAGIEAQTPTAIHGRDFLPLLKGETIPWDDSFYGEYSMHHTAQADMRMYRTPEWKLMIDYKNPGKNELYHLSIDPGETKNLIDMAEYAEIQKQLEDAILKRMRAIKDPLLDRLAKPTV